LLLYDWDNTLVDAWAGIAVALNAVFAAFDRPAWTVGETRARVRLSLREAFPAMFGADWPRARDIFYATLAEQHLDHLQPMPGVEAMLDAAGGRPQGVVSNKTGRFLRAEIDRLGWRERFGAVVGAGDAAADKPNPAPILLALARLGRSPEASVWYIGDTMVDVAAARAAGVSAILVGDASHDGGADARDADWTFGSAADLAHTISSLA